MKRDVAKIFVLSLLSLFLINFIAGVVSAADAADTTNGQVVFDSITKALNASKLNPETLSSVLLGILLFIVLYSVVKGVFSFSGRSAGISAAVVSLVITILTFIYLPANFVQAIALQYGAMGATILTVIPFAIIMYFTVVVTKTKVAAIATWLFYSIYYFTMFLYKVASSNVLWSADNIPYFGAILAGIVMIFVVGFMRKEAFNIKLSSDEEAAERNLRIRRTERQIELDEAAARNTERS